MREIFQYQVQQTFSSCPIQDLDIPEKITAIKCTSDYLLLGSENGSIHVYDIEKREIIKSFEKQFQGAVLSIWVDECFHKRGRRLSYADDAYEQDVEKGEDLEEGDQNLEANEASAEVPEEKETVDMYKINNKRDQETAQIPSWSFRWNYYLL